MDENRLKRVAQALKKLARGGELEGSLMGQGLSVRDLSGLLDLLSEDLHMVGILSMDEPSTFRGDRVFSLWEKSILSKEVRHFLLSALYTKVITPAELEQALALAFTQFDSFVDMEDIFGLLQNVIEDQERVTLFISSELGYKH